MTTQRKYIFVTGGVLSSVGKGVTTAALGRVLKEYGFRVAAQKLDPYLNVDPGTMSPYQHGEVFVLDDGAETDLDLGHYERFMDVRLNRACNVTTGQVYAEVIAKERRGDFLGGTIQVIPHITNEIKRRIALVAETLDAEIVIVEIGGTVGDYESVAFLEAIRQMRSDVGRENTAYIHVTWLPYIRATGELKTKPTQHSVRELRSAGISPDMIIARSDYPVPTELIDKIALFCDVEPRAVVPLVTTDVLYEVPLVLEDAGVAPFLLERLNLRARKQPDWRAWRELVTKARANKPKLTIALVGKYVELHDAYLSVKEALIHAGLALDLDVHILWVQATDLEKDRPDAWEAVRQADGILVPGGFDSRGVEGKIKAARYAREHKVPYFGLCLGMQLMVVEFARHVLGTEDVHSTEFDPNTKHPVIDLMPDQRTITEMGGTMRLGLYPCVLQPGTKAAEAYGVPVVEERHRHRFEFNNAYREVLTQAGMVFSGLSPDGRLVEIAELRDHPFMLGTQFHPEFLSRPTRPHPLFVAFLRAAREHQQRRHATQAGQSEPDPTPQAA
ncbi:MAG: CTP synthase [Chloroflexi bacterium]|nr:CTP synthase [Chloroflexota bacterium]